MLPYQSFLTESAVMPKNYFVMLDEGPIRILGRMMFHKKMPPARWVKRGTSNLYGPRHEKTFVFGVSNQVIPKTACLAKETS